MMKTLLNLGLVLLSLSAFSAVANEVSLTPNAKNVSLIGAFAGATTDFVKVNDSFVVRVIVKDKSGRTAAVNKVVTFAPLEGKIVQKENDLYFQNAGVETLVAHHQWYNSPYWQTVSGVSLKTSVRKLNLSDYKVKATLDL